MKRFLCDSNVIIELTRGARCHPKVDQWRRSLAKAQLLVPAIAAGEFFAGNPDKQELRIFQRLIAHKRSFLPVELTAAKTFGLVSREMPLGVTIEANDLWIAVIARTWRLTVATRNKMHFSSTKVDLFDPWSD